MSDTGIDVLIIRKCSRWKLPEQGGQCVFLCQARPVRPPGVHAILASGSWEIFRSCRGHCTWVGSIFELHPGSFLVSLLNSPAEPWRGTCVNTGVSYLVSRHLLLPCPTFISALQAAACFKTENEICSLHSNLQVLSLKSSRYKSWKWPAEPYVLGLRFPWDYLTLHFQLCSLLFIFCSTWVFLFIFSTSWVFHECPSLAPASRASVISVGYLELLKSTYMRVFFIQGKPPTLTTWLNRNLQPLQIPSWYPCYLECVPGTGLVLKRADSRPHVQSSTEKVSVKVVLWTEPP